MSLPDEIVGVVLAGYTGRDRQKVLHHIEELAALGVPPPPRIPMFYPVERGLVTSDSRMTVAHAKTSGEVEVTLFGTRDGLLVGVGSDHTDRAHEALDVAASKGRCRKVIGRKTWLFDEVRGDWDRLELRSWTTDDQGRRLYQEGRLESILRVEDLLEAMGAAGAGDISGKILFCGTVPTREGIVYGRRFEGELYDPTRRRRISFAYDVTVANAETSLPV